MPFFFWNSKSSGRNQPNLRTKKLAQQLLGSSKNAQNKNICLRTLTTTTLPYPAPSKQVMSTATPCKTAWEEVGLSALRTSLDEQALAIAEHQESSLESRKALAAQAKSFRLSIETELGKTSDIRAASGELVRSFFCFGYFFFSFFFHSCACYSMFRLSIFYWMCHGLRE